MSALSDAILDKWAEGMSSSQIAAALALTSKNTVFGAIHRARTAGDKRALLKAPPRKGWEAKEPSPPKAQDSRIPSVTRYVPTYGYSAEGQAFTPVSLARVTLIDGPAV